jgi:hypothetical protein
LIASNSADYKKTDRHTIEFPITVAPDEEKTLTYRARYSWQVETYVSVTNVTYDFSQIGLMLGAVNEGPLCDNGLQSQHFSWFQR